MIEKNARLGWIVLGVWSMASISLAQEHAPPFSGIYVHLAPFASGTVDGLERETRLDDALEAIVACGFTTVIPYANTSDGKVFWKGSAAAVVGNEEWELLRIFSEKARARGLTVMPAFCVLVCGHDVPAGILTEHPEWALRSADGAPLGWLSPASPHVREWILSLACHLERHLRPEGILLDYLRYPSDGTVRFDPYGEDQFEAYVQSHSPGLSRGQLVQQFKEAQLTELMKELSVALREQNPRLRLGLYSWGAHVAHNHSAAQAWPLWLERGYVDMISISGYCYKESDGEDYLAVFTRRLREAADLARSSNRRATLTFALGAKTSHGTIPNADALGTYLTLARRLGYDGVTAFAWEGLKPFAAAAASKGYFRLAQSLPLPVQNEVAYECTIDFGRDVGQHLGTVFEIADPAGHALAGAGFMGAYNTYYRSDRFLLHVFVRPPKGDDVPEISSFPRPSPLPQQYVFGSHAALYADGRSGPESVYQFNPEDARWEPSGVARFQIGHQYCAMSANRLALGGTTLLEFDASVGTAAMFYFANDFLFFHVAKKDSAERATCLYACPWAAGTGARPAIDQAAVLDLPAPGEFPYSYGQLHESVYVATNNGGVYRFVEGKWHTLRPSDPKTSFQIYSMLNYYNRLLLGHYPSGELYEIAGATLVHLPGWPPRPAEASPRAREAQTLAIYRGELFAGIWPWGELWRLPSPEDPWSYVGRVFTHPPLDPTRTAPYDKEMAQKGIGVTNLWGQRVTSLIPYNGLLVIGTANKNGTLYDESFDFLTVEQASEYGAVHQLRLPGHVSVPFEYTGNPQTFRVCLTSETLTLGVDGNPITTLRVPWTNGETGGPLTLRWGQGIFGPCYGMITLVDTTARE